METRKMICSICDREFSPEDEGVRMPFCSLRCKMIDQSRWLDENYGLPYENIDELEEKNAKGPFPIDDEDFTR